MAQPEVIPTHLSGAPWAQLLWWSAITGSTNAVGCGAVGSAVWAGCGTRKVPWNGPQQRDTVPYTGLLCHGCLGLCWLNPRVELLETAV